MANYTALYSGPCDVTFNGVGIQSEAENGSATVNLVDKTADIGVAQFGKIGEQEVAQEGEISTKPFDNWGSLTVLFPTYLGVTTGASKASPPTGGTAGALRIGTRPHNPLSAGVPASDVPVKVWTPDGRLYLGGRAAIITHPTLHLGVGKALFGDIKISVLPPSPSGSTVALLSPVGTIYTVSESGVSDPAPAFIMTDFTREAWTGVWGTVAGFGGAAGSLQGSTPVPVEAADEWTIETSVKYSAITIQGGNVAYKLDSVSFMAKCKPYGPSHTDITAAIQNATHAQGKRLQGADLYLTSGLSGHVIALPNVQIKSGGFTFGGTGLGTGEIGFVSQMGFNTNTVPSGTQGQPDPLLIFST